MAKFICDLILCKIFGWKVTGFTAPVALQHLVVAAPHTSNWDFPLGVLSRPIHGINHVKFLGKSTLFIPPFGWFFRALGGYPVERSKNSNLVQAVIEIYKKDPTFSVCISPEGTRKYTNKLKTGFYYMAQGANIPLIFMTLDYTNKVINFSEPYHLTNDFEKDMKHIVGYFRGIKGHSYTFDMEYPWKEN